MKMKRRLFFEEKRNNQVVGGQPKNMTMWLHFLTDSGQLFLLVLLGICFSDIKAEGIWANEFSNS